MMTMAVSGHRSLTKHEREKMMRVFSVLGELLKGSTNGFGRPCYSLSRHIERYMMTYELSRSIWQIHVMF